MKEEPKRVKANQCPNCNQNSVYKHTTAENLMEIRLGEREIIIDACQHCGTVYVTKEKRYEKSKKEVKVGGE